MGKRMTTTSEQISPAKKPVEDDGRAGPKRDHDRVRESLPSRVEPFDWRGEGVVGNNHTD